MTIFWDEMARSAGQLLMIFGFLAFLAYATQGDFSNENDKK